MKLGTLLLRNATISLTQLETALRSQIMYGGRLGTNLIELGFLDVEGLTGALAELKGVPVATTELLDAVTPQTLALVNPAVAEQLGVVPLGQLASFPDGLAVAMVDPRDEAAIEELGRLTSHSIVPHVLSEARCLYYLERLYNLPRKARYVRAGTRRLLATAVERRRAQPPGGLVPPPPVRVEPRGNSGPIAIPVAAPGVAPTISFDETCDRLADATHRDHIAAALLEYAVGRTAAMVLFLIRDGNALGWRGYTAAPSPTAISDISLAIGGASALQIVSDEVVPFRGPPPTPGHPTETQLWTALGLPAASELVVAPVVVRDRPVNLVYCHPLAGAGFSDAVAHELLALCGRASDAYVRLIQRSKS